jgi:hypothetical protein
MVCPGAGIVESVTEYETGYLDFDSVGGRPASGHIKPPVERVYFPKGKAVRT